PPRTRCARGTHTTPRKFAEFGSRYRQELGDPGRVSALRHLRPMAGHDRLTLLTATKRLDLSQVAILASS
ncbi:MAG TPA: DUF488 family protein, partial [Microbacterium sp.]|nr:DUF488 family protein [Microbacterium sp.]